jgi:hypothetical protein
MRGEEGSEGREEEEVEEEADTDTDTHTEKEKEQDEEETADGEEADKGNVVRAWIMRLGKGERENRDWGRGRRPGDNNEKGKATEHETGKEKKDEDERGGAGGTRRMRMIMGK